MLRAPCTVPRGVTSDCSGYGFGAREVCAAVSSAVPAPLAVVHKTRAMDVSLTAGARMDV